MRKHTIKKLRKNTYVLLGIIFLLHVMVGNTIQNKGSIELETNQVTERENRGNTMRGESQPSTLLQRERQVYTSHDPISIDGDEGFSNYSFPGTGTAEDPYKIEGLNITTTQRYGIYITNTTVHFVIAHCYLRTQKTAKDIWYRGIYLYQIMSGTAHITNNTITGNWFGIHVTAAYVALDHITATISIVNNTLTGNIVGIDCTTFGYAVIANNTITDNSVVSIYLSYFTNATVYSNIITDTSRGIHTTEGHTTTISNNTILTDDFGIIVRECNVVDIINNIIFDGSYGIYWVNYEYGNRSIITNNTVIGSQYGMYLGANYRIRSVIAYNNIVSNSKYGVYLDAYNCTIYANNFIGNGGEDSQGFGVGRNSTWYNETSQQGNYWSDYDGKGTYVIDGVGSDLYPLSELIDPVLTKTYYAPDKPNEEDEITIHVTVKETIAVDQVLLKYWDINGNWQEALMIRNGSMYSVTLEPFSERTIILYYVSVQNSMGVVCDSSFFGFVVHRSPPDVLSIVVFFLRLLFPFMVIGLSGLVLGLLSLLPFRLRRKKELKRLRKEQAKRLQKE